MPNEKDIGEKILEAHNDVFADIVNVLLFNGREVIKAEDLESSQLRSQFRADGSLHEQERDASKIWRQGLIRITCFGLENQTQAEREMPFRTIGFDGASYKEQLIRRDQQERAGEKKDPLYPVITLILYFGKPHWNYPKNLSDCLEVEAPPELLPFINDYKIHVFEIAHLTPEQVKMFKSDFRFVADYVVQTTQNNDYIPSADEITHVEELFKLLSAMTGDHRFEDAYNGEHYQKGEPITMFDVITEYENRGRAKGREEGREEGAFLTLCRLVKRGLLSPAVAAEDAGMDEQDFLSKMEQAYPG